MKNSLTSVFNIVRIIRAGGYSIAGLKAAVVHEAAFRQELVLLLFLAPLGFYLGSTAIERILLIGSLLIVLIVELLNSALEAVVNRISQEHHELSGRAKDLGSAAVFVAIVLVIIVWSLVLIPKYL